MTNQPSVAVLGAGALGAAIAARLGDTGHQVKLWNRTPDRARAAAAASTGVTAVADIGNAVKNAPVVLTLLRDGDAVMSVMQTVIDSLDAGAVWVQASTVGPESARALAELAGPTASPISMRRSRAAPVPRTLAHWSGWSPGARTPLTGPSRPCVSSVRSSNISEPALKAARSRSPSTPG